MRLTIDACILNFPNIRITNTFFLEKTTITKSPSIVNISDFFGYSKNIMKLLYKKWIESIHNLFNKRRKKYPFMAEKSQGGRVLIKDNT